MLSRVIRQAALTMPNEQLTLDFEPGLVERYGSLRECIATGVYRRGLGNVALDLDKAPGNLSVELSGDASRHFSVDSLERYLEKSKDFTAVYYLVEKFLSDKKVKNDAAMSDVVDRFAELKRALNAAGIV
ncbi:MAG: hypothetical protein JO269_09475 [Burkholderiaceae bacterium]|nr:hypothetical protein [Burkholderiaceae bacterium]